VVKEVLASHATLIPCGKITPQAGADSFGLDARRFAIDLVPSAKL
jgi:hypothetical protein